AVKYPKKLQQLKDLWWSEAGRYNVLPLGATGSLFVEMLAERAKPRQEVFHGPVQRIPESIAPDIKTRSHRATVSVEIPETGAEGVFYAMGGLSLYLKDGYVTYHYNFAGIKHTVIRSSRKLPAGRTDIKLDVTPVGLGPGVPANVKLLFGEEEVGSGQVPNTASFRFSIHETFNIGADLLTPVTSDYAVPFAFTGKIHRTIFDLR
ncbi:MAG TPA: hypothetical protein VEQ16_11235, partial [Acidocella sp.]|nr:hypothetical protein [Acidocella sp.]